MLYNMDQVIRPRWPKVTGSGFWKKMAHARCVPATVCVVRLDVARIDEPPGWLVPPATRVFELGQVYPLQLWVTLPTQKSITSVSWNFFWLLSKTLFQKKDVARDSSIVLQLLLSKLMFSFKISLKQKKEPQHRFYFIVRGTLFCKLECL